MGNPTLIQTASPRWRGAARLALPIGLALLGLAGVPGLWPGVWAAPQAQGGTFTVNTTADENDGCATGGCSLRDAILDANADPQADVIVLPAGSYTLTLAAGGDLPITQPVTLLGAGAADTIINGAGLTRVFDIAGATVVISGVTLYNGNAGGGSGGGLSLDSAALVTLTHSTVYSNTADKGGGLANAGGRLWLEAVTLLSNTTTSGGGGLYLYAGSQLTMTAGLVQGNRAGSSGGGLNADAASTSWITASQFVHNTSLGGGGGLSNSGTLSLAAVEVRGNTAEGYPGGGGLRQTAGALTLATVTFSANQATYTSGSGGALVVEAGQVTGTAATLGPDNYAGNDGGGLALIAAAAQVSLSQSAILSNTAADDGGGVENRGLLNLDQSTLLGNTAYGTLGGGGLNNNSAATTWITASTISHNHAADSGGDGGGLLVYSGAVFVTDSTVGPGNIANDDGGGATVRAFSRLTLTNSHVVSNVTESTSNGSGAGLHNDEGTLVLDHTQVVGNIDYGGFGGGGIRTNSDVGILGLTILRNGSVVRDNQTARGDGGGVFVFSGQLLVSDSAIEGNRAGRNGGGLALNLFNASQELSLSVTISNSLIANNSALTSTTSRGGGIYQNGGQLDLINTTLSGNAAEEGGALSVANADLARTAALTMTHVTVADNSGDAGVEVISGVAVARNSVFAQSGTPNCSGALISQGHNLENGASCALTAAGDLPNRDPLLAALADNAGATWTHALQPGSPAIDQADAAFCPALDQRGSARLAAGACDIGAYEYTAVDLRVTNTNQEALVIPGLAVTYTVRVVNVGAYAVAPAPLTSVPSANLLTPQWGCVASPGSACSSGAGAGAASVALSLLAGGEITLTLTATVAEWATGAVTNTATVASVKGLPDAALNNNTATDLDWVIDGTLGRYRAYLPAVQR